MMNNKINAPSIAAAQNPSSSVSTATGFPKKRAAASPAALDKENIETNALTYKAVAQASSATVAAESYATYPLYKSSESDKPNKKRASEDDSSQVQANSNSDGTIKRQCTGGEKKMEAKEETQNRGLIDKKKATQDIKALPLANDASKIVLHGNERAETQQSTQTNAQTAASRSAENSKEKDRMLPLVRESNKSAYADKDASQSKQDEVNRSNSQKGTESQKEVPTSGKPVECHPLSRRVSAAVKGGQSQSPKQQSSHGQQKYLQPNGANAEPKPSIYDAKKWKGGWMPMNRNVFVEGGDVIGSDKEGKYCVPDAVATIVNRLGHKVPVAKVRKALSPKEGSLYTDTEDVTKFVRNIGFEIGRLPRRFFNSPQKLLGLENGNYIFLVKFWLEGDDLTQPPPAHQEHAVAFLACTRTLVDNLPGAKPRIIESSDLENKDTAKQVFKDMWEQVTKFQIHTTFCIYRPGKAEPGVVNELFFDFYDVSNARRTKLKKKRKVDQMICMAEEDFEKLAETACKKKAAKKRKILKATPEEIEKQKRAKQEETERRKMEKERKMVERKKRRNKRKKENKRRKKEREHCQKFKEPEMTS